MLSLYLKLLFGIVLSTSFAVIAAPLVGRLRPTNPVIDGMVQGCVGQSQPCWYGIQPGKTSMTEALQKIEQTPYTLMDQYNQVLVLVYRNESTRCGVEIHSEAGLVDKLTIQNCFDTQIGNVVEAMHNSSRHLPFSTGMLESLMSTEINDSTVIEAACLNFTPYGQIIGMRLNLSSEAAMSAPADWGDFLPYGWFVHHGGGLTCDVVNAPTFGIG